MIGDIVQCYFETGFTNDEILSFVANYHGVMMSNSTLKRIMKGRHLIRRKRQTELLDVALFLLKELQASSQLHGYRWMHLKCIQAGIRVPRDTVMHLLQLLHPEGVAARKQKRLKRRQYISKGPNFVWHLDSYDKLKSYGIAINGCIDGFSRNLIWLEAHSTNSSLTL